MQNQIKVLIPTDFSVQAEFAFIMVRKIGAKIPIEVHFLHVLSVPDTVTMDPDGSIQTCGEIDVRYVESQRDIALRNLENLKKTYGPEIRTDLVLGKTTDAIVRYAESNGFDLIAMGTKGAWGLKEKISGSETQMIARHTRVPVLSLMCDRSDLEFKNVLLVHNFKETHHQDLRILKLMVEAFETKVHFLQIAKTSNPQEKREIENHMAEFASANGIGGYEPHVLVDSDIESGVTHFNQMTQMDLVCIGTHAKGGWFHSSATEKLINHMFKPIISFHLK